MSPFEMMKKIGLMSWPVVFFGLKKKFINKKNIADYAVERLIHGEESEEIVLLAGCESLSDEDVYSLLSAVAGAADDDIDKWRLVNLLMISESGFDSNRKINLLQKVYADFGYPEDMQNCGIYSMMKSDPLDEMNTVIKNLKTRYSLN